MNNNSICREVPLSVRYYENCDINKNKVGEKLCRYYNCKKHFTVDGYDKTTKTAYLFQGCYWHGCRKCHPENIIRYDKTMEQVNLLESNKYKVVQMWECEWNETKKSLPNKTELEENAIQQNINIRDAFFGGRTEGFKSYHKCNEYEKLFYYDVVSLYPTVNALDEYAVGFSKYVSLTLDNINNNDSIWNDFIGIVKVDITPPNNIYVPLLPDNSNKKNIISFEGDETKIFYISRIKICITIWF